MLWLRWGEKEKVMEAWVADPRTDSYLLSDGSVVDAGLEDSQWYESVISRRKYHHNRTISGSGHSRDDCLHRVTGGIRERYRDNRSFGFDVYLDTLKQTLSDIKVGEAGYLELISNSSDYIYSDDPTASGKKCQ